MPFRSVAENIFLGREPRRFGLIDWSDDAATRAANCSIRSACRSMCSKPVREFSTAIQQMVALARAVSSDAKMVIMDESTSSLDEREVELLFTVVRSLRDDGRAVIFVSHRLDELYALCDRVTVMRDGQTVAQSTMAEMDKLQLVTTMLGRTLAAVVQEDSAVTEANLAQARQATAISATQLGAQREGDGRVARCARGRSRRPRRSARLGPHGNHAADVRRGSAERRLAVDRRRSRSTLKSPQDAIARGIAYLTEDRKGEGIVPELSVRDNLTLVCLRTLTKHGVVDVAKQQAIVDRFHRIARHQAALRRSADSRTLGRQSAEGAARALARREPVAAAARRTHARHRRRRESGCREDRPRIARLGAGGAAVGVRTGRTDRGGRSRGRDPRWQAPSPNSTAPR